MLKHNNSNTTILETTFSEYLIDILKSYHYCENNDNNFVLNETIKNNAKVDITNPLDTILVPSMVDFKTMTRKGIITVISMMLDSLNAQYMSQHNGDSLFGKGSIYRKLMTK